MIHDNVKIEAGTNQPSKISSRAYPSPPIPGGVQVVTDAETPVSIYAIDGTILVNAEPVQGCRTFTIPAGLYIIAAGDTARRLVLR